jgi:hypothetical protein
MELEETSWGFYAEGDMGLYDNWCLTPLFHQIGHEPFHMSLTLSLSKVALPQTLVLLILHRLMIINMVICNKFFLIIYMNMEFA